MFTATRNASSQDSYFAADRRPASFSKIDIRQRLLIAHDAARGAFLDPAGIGGSQGIGSILSEIPRYKIKMMTATKLPIMKAAISSESGGKWQGYGVTDDTTAREPPYNCVPVVAAS